MLRVVCINIKIQHDEIKNTFVYVSKPDIYSSYQVLSNLLKWIFRFNLNAPFLAMLLAMNIVVSLILFGK